MTYILNSVTTMNYNCVLPEDICDLYTGHCSDACTVILYSWKTCVTYILDM